MTLHTSHSQRGFTLIELMIALTIGLLVTLAIGSLFITTRQDYKQNDSTAKMQENARFALESLTTDLRHAGFFGSTPAPATIDISSMSPTAPTPNCGGSGSGLYDFTQTNTLMDFGNQIADITANTVLGGCFSAADKVKPDSSILMVKRVENAATAPLLQNDPSTAIDDTTTDNRVNGRPYVYTNGGQAVLYTDTSKSLTLAGGESWEYQPRIYYLDTEDHLRRKQLSGLALVSEPLADGVEAFHIEFGINTTSSDNTFFDGVPSYFYTPDANLTSDAATDLNQAVSATVYVLARTTEPDPDPTFQDQKTYTLGTKGPTYGPFGGPSGTNELIDGKTTAASRYDYRYSYHHRVYSITVMLKNLRSQLMTRQKVN